MPLEDDLRFSAKTKRDIGAMIWHFRGWSAFASVALVGPLACSKYKSQPEGLESQATAIAELNNISKLSHNYTFPTVVSS
jgi:hypothetical protein